MVSRLVQSVFGSVLPDSLGGVRCKFGGRSRVVDDVKRKVAYRGAFFGGHPLYQSPVCRRRGGAAGIV